MSFCTYSTEVIKDDFVRVDNAFIVNHMPDCNPECLRVYLWGLYKCNNPTSVDNTLEGFSRVLNLSEDDVISCFKYWEEVNLVQVLNLDPIQVKYLPVKNSSVNLRKFNKDKYKKFNLGLQELLSGRMITPNEYNQFYYTMESMHIDQDAMLKIVKYCTEQKGENVGYAYILTIAKNWAYQGITTAEAVDNRLIEQQKSTGDIKLVLKSIGIKRNATDDEFNKFITWTRDYDIPLDNILIVAKHVDSGMGAFNKLNSYIEKCYTLRLNSEKEINDYFNNEQNLFDLAKSICKNLGVRYDRLDTIVDTYINNWLSLGFDNDTLIKVANYCFISSVRTLQGMNNMIDHLFKLGLVTAQAIDNHIEQLTKDDEKLQHILRLLGLVRSVNASDRVLLKTWVYDWNLSMDIIEYACTQCEGKYLPMQYLNKLLSTYHVNNVKSVDEATKVTLPTNEPKKTTSSKKPTAREYTKSELDALFTNLNEVEL